MQWAAPAPNRGSTPRRSGPEPRRVHASDEIARRLVKLTPVLPVSDFPTNIIIDPDAPTSVIIDQVTFIRSFAGAGAVVDSHIGSLDNWARYELLDSAGIPDANGFLGHGTGRLSFLTLLLLSGHKYTRLTIFKKKEDGLFTQKDRQHGYSYESRYPVVGLAICSRYESAKLPKWAVPSHDERFSLDNAPDHLLL
jgi:hypothetical protein